MKEILVCADVVERLRATNHKTFYVGTMAEAADEIERLRANISGYEENEIQLERWVEERDAEILALKQRIRALESGEHRSGSGGQVGSHADLHATGVRHPNVDGSSSTPAIRHERLRARLEAHESGYDGISCRDETIRNQDAIIDNLRARVAEIGEIRRALGPYALVPPDGGAEPTADLVRDLVTRVAELEAAQEWRPIESAPKIGRTPPLCNFHEILGRDSVGRVAVIAWGDASEQWLDGDGRTFYPAEWLPLPAPPKVAT